MLTFVVFKWENATTAYFTLWYFQVPSDTFKHFQTPSNTFRHSMVMIVIRLRE